MSKPLYGWGLEAGAYLFYTIAVLNRVLQLNETNHYNMWFLIKSKYKSKLKLVYDSIFIRISIFIYSTELSFHHH